MLEVFLVSYFQHVSFFQGAHPAFKAEWQSKAQWMTQKNYQPVRDNVRAH